MPHAGCPFGGAAAWQRFGVLGAGLSFRSVPIHSGMSFPATCARERGVTAQGARGDRWVSLGAALRWWHTAALLHPAPPASSCSAPHPAVPRHLALGTPPVTPAPSHGSLLLFSAFFSVLSSPVPSFISPPQPPREVLRKPRPSCGSSRRPRVTKPPTPAPSSHRGAGGKPEKRPKKPQWNLQRPSAGAQVLRRAA